MSTGAGGDRKGFMTNNYFKIRTTRPLLFFFDDTLKESANEAWSAVEATLTSLGHTDYRKVSLWKRTRCDGPWDGVVRAQGWTRDQRLFSRQAA